VDDACGFPARETVPLPMPWATAVAMVARQPHPRLASL